MRALAVIWGHFTLFPLELQGPLFAVALLELLFHGEMMRADNGRGIIHFVSTISR